MRSAASASRWSTRPSRSSSRSEAVSSAAASSARPRRRVGPTLALMGVCRIIPLGGLGEVGKNMTAYEANDSIVVVDAGLAFPRDEHLGVDLVLPDFSYLRERASSIRAVILTHGHEDHVGSLPYLMREVPIPEVWATRLTLGLVKSKLDEHGLLRAAELREVHPDDPAREIGPFRISFVRMAHSIPDSAAVVLETPAGRIVHTGDYKLDHTPVDGLKTDVGKLAELGNQGVDLLLGDSTNAERPGFTQSERIVGEAFRQIFPLREGRILVASFASNVHRMQQAVDVAVDLGRKVCIVGRSMRKNTNIARNRGYTVIISAKPVPGNELRVHDTINQLAKTGAEVLHQEIAPVHVSGHACAEELRTLLSLVRPKAVMPIHGEFRMLAAHGQLARESGVPAANIVLAENGTVVELSREGVRVVGEVETGVTFVDGLGVGDVHDVALRDRRRLSEDGVLIVVATVAGSDDGAAGPTELIARGFGDGSGELLEELREEADRVLRDLLHNEIVEIKLLQEHLHDELGQLVYDRTHRRPMILPVVVEV